MVLLSQLQTTVQSNQSVEYQCQANLNLYDSPDLTALATQAVTNRQLRVVSLPFDADGQGAGAAVQVRLCEDNYPGWLPLEDLDLIEPAETPYEAIDLTEAEIRARIPSVIAYAYATMSQPNYYLWGGTVGPNYDCSGLVQTAFASAGIWVPRDSYQQEAFTQPVALEALIPGDLVFFGTPERTTHVGLYLGERCYIHSSGKAQGRNGIGIDTLSTEGDEISRAYFQQFRRAGRVVSSFS
ncbi:C40 family peptidase [Oculatella sp. LEGE 06141]|uniref:C40 family peptidase n=1 Tax=Oculatella sp. LEGE 06141 TaxID=1828648 RepID=UPI001880C264|nr:C40 family peptidase [Oculatella sp. LEGE 06141]MBE9177363.1 C40 family peptidase [Oculatella sp. LEGE 06141]